MIVHEHVMHVPILYDGVWACFCGFETNNDRVAWQHYGRKAGEDA